MTNLVRAGERASAHLSLHVTGPASAERWDTEAVASGTVLAADSAGLLLRVDGEAFREGDATAAPKGEECVRFYPWSSITYVAVGDRP